MYCDLLNIMEAILESTDCSISKLATKLKIPVTTLRNKISRLRKLRFRFSRVINYYALGLNKVFMIFPYLEPSDLGLSEPELGYFIRAIIPITPTGFAINMFVPVGREHEVLSQVEDYVEEVIISRVTEYTVPKLSKYNWCYMTIEEVPNNFWEQASVELEKELEKETNLKPPEQRVMKSYDMLDLIIAKELEKDAFANLNDVASKTGIPYSRLHRHYISHVRRFIVGTRFSVTPWWTIMPGILAVINGFKSSSHAYSVARFLAGLPVTSGVMVGGNDKVLVVAYGGETLVSKFAKYFLKQMVKHGLKVKSWIIDKPMAFTIPYKLHEEYEKTREWKFKLAFKQG